MSGTYKSWIYVIIAQFLKQVTQNPQKDTMLGQSKSHHCKSKRQSVFYQQHQTLQSSSIVQYFLWEPEISTWELRNKSFSEYRARKDNFKKCHLFFRSVFSLEYLYHLLVSMLLTSFKLSILSYYLPLQISKLV